jgi:hypothetical protein
VPGLSESALSLWNSDAFAARRNIDRHRGLRGAFAGSAGSIEPDLDYGWRRRDYHDVTQQNS